MKKGLKTKLTLALSTIALGATLIGAGTFAYFNDVDHVNNRFAAGVLDLTLEPGEGSTLNFDLSNMKPGDSVTRFFTLGNDGTLAIKNVLMKGSASNFVDGNNAGDSNWSNFLNQFDVKVIRVQNTVTPEQPNAYPTDTNVVINPMTLYDLVAGNFAGHINPNFLTADNSINIAPTGIPVKPVDKDGVRVEITFRNDNQSQNMYQGDAINFAFDLTATQTDGVAIGGVAPNGYISSNETLTPNPAVIDSTKATVTAVDETPFENPLEP